VVEKKTDKISQTASYFCGLSVGRRIASLFALDFLSKPPLFCYPYVTASNVPCLDGAYLLSGAKEAVLVTWQIGNGQKNFLPRLGAPILGISTSPDGSRYALSSADNAIRLINPVANKYVFAF
jgi:WD40 repeat protein